MRWAQGRSTLCRMSGDRSMFRRISTCFHSVSLVAIVLLGCALPFVRSAPAPQPKPVAIEVVFCLDTTGSMTGMIDGAKSKIWAICNQMLNGRPMPILKVGLVAFRDKGDEYVTKVYDLRDDLDEVYADVQTFVATGGGDTPEAVNQALDDAVNKISWSRDGNTLKILYLVGDAPPHMDYTDDVKYPITCALAAQRGILINTIQCGNDADCTRYWKDICERGKGAYVAIPQGGGTKGISTPFDRRLAEINAELARSTIVFGDPTKRENDMKKAKVVESLATEIAADRAGYLAKEGRVARYDLLDAIRSGKFDLASIPSQQLPAELQKMTLKERREHLARLAEKRTKLLTEARDLDRQRGTHMMREMDKNKDSFDAQVLLMLRKQTSRRIYY
jgi:von Willebrand factor type A domain